MDKIKRNERVAAMMHAFVSASPGHYFSLNEFTECFGAAKSSVSEDISLLREVLGRNSAWGPCRLSLVPPAASNTSPASAGDQVDMFF